MKEAAATTVILSVSEELRVGHTEIFAHAQNDRHMRSIPSAFLSTFAVILDEYAGFQYSPLSRLHEEISQ